MKPLKILLFSVCALILVLIFASQPSARIYVDINQPFAKKMPLAIPDFINLNFKAAPITEYSDTLSELIRKNLNRTGLFIIQDNRTFLEVDKRAGFSEAAINYRDWLTIGTELLIKGAYDVSEDSLTLRLMLLDVFDKKQILGKQYRGRPDDAITMLNRFMNEVLMLLTRERGSFGSTLAFIGRQGKSKEVFIARLGDPSVIRITNNGSINMSPVFSTNGKELAYISYKTGKPQLWLRNITKGGEKKVNRGGNLYLSPGFTPTGEMMVAISHSSNSNIYLLDAYGKIKRPMTQKSGINISPTISPDGKKFAFVSNRAGNPQLYVKSMDGGESLRLTFEGDYNTDPTWSPKGDRIIYVGMVDKNFNIYTINSDGSNRQQLTSGEYDDLNPCWSPDGRLIIFSSNRDGGRHKLYTMTANGERQLPLDLDFEGEETNPSWSTYGTE